GRIRIMRKFYMIMKTIFFFRDPEAQVPFHSYFLPGLIPFFLCTGTNKVLHLHLFKLSHAENKLSCYNFISECFSNLCDTKRNFQATCFLDIQKVYKDPLGCFGSQIDLIGFITYTSYLSAEH